MYRLRRSLNGLIVGYLFLVLLTASQTRAADLHELTLDGPSATVAPFKEDAGLYDVQFVGTKTGWAVGDHGVVWKTDDGGHKWRLLATPVDCTLLGVCFLTDRVGWIVGGGTTPHTRQGFGVLLFTNDGGTTWEQLGRETLPSLSYVRFFGMKRGVVVGETSSPHPTGVLMTEDGGRSWKSIVGKERLGWRTASFVSPEIGIVAGLRGGTALISQRQLLPTRLSQSGLHGFYGAQLQQDASGWLVGDGGRVLWTDNGGLVWQDPPAPLPLNVSDITDFRTVAARGAKAWLAGTPGSVIWHTPDGGRTWRPQPTGQSVPIQALSFVNETEGWAVGALGTILKTEDGGGHWSAVRGRGRRLALMTVHARASRLSFHLTAHQSAELGYRSLNFLPVRHDIGQDGHNEQDQDLRLHAAVVAAGGATGIVGWRLPIALPDIDHSKEQLIADWKRRTDDRLPQTMLGDLVCRLRTWRPSVVVIDKPSEDDAAGLLLNEALLKAVEQAADASRFTQQLQLAALKPWQVKKVFLRLPPGSEGDTEIDRHEYLTRTGRTAHEVAISAGSRLNELPSQTAQRETYRLIVDNTKLPNANVARHDFFSGLGLSAGSAARRSLAGFDDRENEQRREIARKQRNFQAYSEQYLDDPRHAAQVIAQLNYLTQGMSDEQAAMQLAQLAEDYRQRAQWDLFESTLVDLVERYPDEPIALEAMRRLMQMWGGAEPAWQRARKVGVVKQRLELDTRLLTQRIEKALQAAQEGTSEQYAAELELGPAPLKTVADPGQLKISDSDEWKTGAVRRWNERALGIASLIRKKSPRYYNRPEIQFSVASLMRFHGGHRLADDFYHRNLRVVSQTAWNKVATSELWLATPYGRPPTKLATCRPAYQPPYLDGLLSDACWKNADEIPLTYGSEGNSAGENQPMALLAYDENYFYFAASLPRVAGTAAEMPVFKGRTYDADLTGFDRVGLFLDLDRDYSTYYALHVDQRGWTAESCWEDQTWNPTWHVAAKGSKTHWRIEVAIPIQELAPRAPVKNEVWAIGIVRTIPAVGVQSWTQPTGSRPRPESFGLVKFD